MNAKTYCPAWKLDAAARCMSDKALKIARDNLALLGMAAARAQRDLPGYSSELIEDLVNA